MEKEFDLSVSNYGTVRGCNYDVAILPWGATEPHNLHLPYLTDCILSHDIAVDVAKHLFEMHQKRCMVLPPVSMGAQNPGQRDLPFCIHYRYETQKGILSDIVASLYHQGFRKLLIINGHGGNSFKNMVRDLTLDYPNFIIATSEWFKMCPAKDFFENPGDHADEVETSVMMFYHPELIRLSEAGTGEANSFKNKELENGQVWIPRNWSMVSKDTGIGNPACSTAEKGKAFAQAVIDKYIDFLLHFSNIKEQSDLYNI